MSQEIIQEFVSPIGTVPHIPSNMTVAQFFLDYQHPSRPVRSETSPWLIDNDTNKCYCREEIRTRTYALANVMKARWNIGDNDCVAFFTPNHVEFPITAWAAHRLGAIAAAANPAFSVDELLYQLNTTKAKLLVVHRSIFSIGLEAAKLAGLSEDRIVIIQSGDEPAPEGYQTLDELAEEGTCLYPEPLFSESFLTEDEAKTKIAFYNFSSGTTGKSKAVAISHYMVVATILMCAANYQIGNPDVPQRFQPGDVAMNTLPLYHIYGMFYNLLFQLYCGSSVVVMSKFSFTGMLQSIVKHKISNLFLVPPIAVMLCQRPEARKFDLSSLRTIMSSAAPLSIERFKQLSALLPQATIFQCYGMTEAGVISMENNGEQREKPSVSAGVLLPGIVARVQRADGTYAGFNEPGELIVKTPSMASGYSNNEAATKETFVDGWVRSGDEVTINEKMEIFIVDRLKEMLKVRGFQVAPAEMEAHLSEHPFVSEVCVVGIPHEFHGELPFAFIVPEKKTAALIAKYPEEEAKLKDILAKHVTDHKVPYKALSGGIEFVDSVPRAESGKLLRRVARDNAKRLLAENADQAPAKHVAA